MSGVVGWDIGGVNTKAARVVGERLVATRAVPFELQRRPAELVALLRRVAEELDTARDDTHAITMTAELSQMFRTKREGVTFVVDAVARAFPGAALCVWATDGRWRLPAAARRDPVAVAAANWAATGRLVGRTWPDCLLLDTGSTTTDVIPIVGGAPVAAGRTDPERLAQGELVYTGALRTPVEAIAASVPVRGRPTGVSAEGFALTGDVHLWRGELEAADYSVPTPDGRPATREFAGERLARVVCADREMLDDAAISAIADALWEAQVSRIAVAIGRVRARHPGLGQAVVAGLGEFLVTAAARAQRLEVIPLARSLGPAARHAAAVAVALLAAAERAADAVAS